MTDIEKRAEELYPYTEGLEWDTEDKLLTNNERDAFIKGYSEGYEKGREEAEGWKEIAKDNFQIAEKAEKERDTLQQRVKELEEEVDFVRGGNQAILDEDIILVAENEQLRKDNARWVEKYNYDYDRVVPLIRKTAETGDKLISVQDCVIAIGKLMKELELKDALIKVIEEQSASRLARINELT
jgi:hypothetical protein